MADISTKVQRQVALLDSEQSILEAARIMTQRYIGSVVVTVDLQVKGIFTERDLMRVVAQQQNPETVRLRDVMRTDLIVASSRDSVDHCLHLMRQNRCRHLLVFDDGRLTGIVSLRDLVSLMLEEKEELVEQLTQYITG